MRQPCDRNCPDRAAVCAVSCPRWAAYVKSRDEEYKRRLDDANVVSAYVEGSIRRGSYTPKPI